MKTVEFRYLSQNDVIDVGLTMKDAISIVEEVLREHGLQEFENPPKPGIHTLQGAFIHAMPGFLPRKKAAGMKWVSGYSDNFQYGLPSIMGLVVLNDPNTGQPLAVVVISPPCEQRLPPAFPPNILPPKMPAYLVLWVPGFKGVIIC